jgi:hypothetical protein
MADQSWTEADFATVLTTKGATDVEVARQLHRTPGSIAYMRRGIHYFHRPSGPGGGQRMLGPRLRAHLEAGRGGHTCPSCGQVF